MRLYQLAILVTMPGPIRSVTPQQTATLRAVVDTIVPADEYPSGTEAGVLDYLDGQFGGDLAGSRACYGAGLDAVDAEAGETYGTRFDLLDPVQREALLRALESGDTRTPWPFDAAVFVSTVVGHVMEGFYGDPGNGGNRDAVSWRMIGFEVGE
ncbi:gluconate 2-dehydrogenase subunit 3 family protein [Nonomuraea turkmeniaca]|uniref:Gluconate 2-dehydrogenase subunit 3 family protein n=1 Tax=Nonomuraea turkmeniaca TaxID=103838 RepID=A0A5S4FNB7_9ACTN|nr:gluconate 2-dehydrogenase subunit 3 family protein [Nonomuraea turkmeniaca]TMR21944.1 gluconate 2-dehydrogenase subunit 3 family protein [Nonomuraea turkmeniaca]